MFDLGRKCFAHWSEREEAEERQEECKYSRWWTHRWVRAGWFGHNKGSDWIVAHPLAFQGLGRLVLDLMMRVVVNAKQDHHSFLMAAVDVPLLYFSPCLKSVRCIMIPPIGWMIYGFINGWWWWWTWSWWWWWWTRRRMKTCFQVTFSLGKVNRFCGGGTISNAFAWGVEGGGFLMGVTHFHRQTDLKLLSDISS